MDFHEFDFLFLAGLFPNGMEEEIFRNSRGSVQQAANNLQWGFVRGFDENEINFSILNMVYIGSFPFRYKKAFIRSSAFSHKEGVNDENLGFCNITGLKYFSRAMRIRKRIKDWLRNPSEKRKVIIAYAMTNTFDSALRFAKKIDKKVITCLIVPDLPQFMNTNSKKRPLYSIFKSIDIKRQFTYARSIDSFVLLTRQMSSFFPNKPFTIVEGIAPDLSNGNAALAIDEWRGKKKILYAGALNQKYGILDLLEAFKLLDEEEYVLLVCGDGECKENVIADCRQHRNIVYLGSLTHDKALSYQILADVLVNPRKEDDDGFTQYSFPSKILEYLATKKPVVCYKLKGIPDEYDSILFYPAGNDNGLLASKIKEVAGMNDIQKANYIRHLKEFLLTKNSKYQVKKLLELLKQYNFD